MQQQTEGSVDSKHYYTALAIIIETKTEIKTETIYPIIFFFKSKNPCFSIMFH